MSSVFEVMDTVGIVAYRGFDIGKRVRLYSVEGVVLLDMVFDDYPTSTDTVVNLINMLEGRGWKVKETTENSSDPKWVETVNTHLRTAIRTMKERSKDSQYVRDRMEELWREWGHLWGQDHHTEFFLWSAYHTYRMIHDTAPSMARLEENYQNPNAPLVVF